MGTIKNIIDKLNSLDLNKCMANKDIQKLIRRIGKIPAPIRVFNVGTTVYRASNLKEEEKITVGRLSYCPKKQNTKYQRASTPKQTMFYGVIGNYNNIDNQLNCEILAMQETCSFFRDSQVKDGGYRVAVSQWNVRRRISLLALMKPNATNKSVRLNEMVNGLYAFIDANNIDKEDAIYFHEYMCGQFTKRVNNNNQYKISALFTKEVIRRKHGGVLWESSVAVDEKLNDTLCVAIKPEVVDSLMECTKYALYTFIINNGKITHYEREEFFLEQNICRKAHNKSCFITNLLKI
jgi:hypothetical protein